MLYTTSEIEISANVLQTKSVKYVTLRNFSMCFTTNLSNIALKLNSPNCVTNIVRFF